MAEELNERQGAVGEVAEPAADQPTGDQGGEQQPSQKLNLDELPEFRAWKSKADQRLSQQEREFRQRESEMLARLNWLQEQMEAKQSEGLDDFGKLQLQNQKLQRSLGDLQNRFQRQQVEMQRTNVLRTISERTGAPLEILKDAENPDVAWAAAVEYMREQTAKVKGDREEKRQRNAVDLGGGKGGGDKTDQAAREAFKRGDPQAYVRALRLAKQRE